MSNVLLVALGGALGAVARYLLSVGIQQAMPAVLPVGTLAVNLAGSFAIGVLYELAAAAVVPPSFRMVAAVGFLGSFTTFSTLALEANTLIRDREGLVAMAYVALTVVGGTLLCLGGMMLARAAMRGP